jgi:hypothetical protein
VEFRNGPLDGSFGFRNGRLDGAFGFWNGRLNGAFGFWNGRLNGGLGVSERPPERRPWGSGTAARRAAADVTNGGRAGSP